MGRTPMAVAALLLLVAACGPDQALVGPPTTPAPPTTAAAGDPASPTTEATATASARRPRPAPTTTITTLPPAEPVVPEGRYREAVFGTGELTETDDLVYEHTTGVDGRDVELALDLYVPEDDPVTRRPVVVLVHGGGFVSGERGSLEAYARDLARRGFAAATVSYRLSDDVGSDWRGPTVRAALALARDDVEAAVGWLQDRAGELGLDPSRVAVMGYSAGAMTAIEVGLHGDVQAVVSIAGTVVEDGEVHGPAAPMLLLHGDADRAVPHDLAESTCALAEEAGVACTLQTFAGVGHEIVSSRRSDVLEAATAFLADALGLVVA